MAEILTDLPADFLDEMYTTPQQKSVLIAQINRFNLLREKEINNKGIVTDEQGRVILPEGTIIHGTSDCDPEKIGSIAKTGVLTGQAVGVYEDGETFYCADFHRVPKNMTMEEYDKQFPYKDGRAPFGGRGKNSLAFVIQPSQELDELLRYDCYREETPESQIAKTFIVEQGLPIDDRFLAASILYGVPSNGFSGIVLGDALFERQEVVEFVIKLFPSCYITSRKGDVIYDPSKEKTDNEELTETRRQKYLLSMENETLKKEMGWKDNEIDKEKARYTSLMNSILRVCSTEQAATVLLANGWQGDLESTMGYVERLKESTAISEKSASSATHNL